RPGGRGGAVVARRIVGKDSADRALAPAARARGRDRRESQGACGARGAERRQGPLVGEGGVESGGRELPFLRLGDRVDRGTREPARRFAPLLLPEGTGRRCRSNRAVELPAD